MRTIESLFGLATALAVAPCIFASQRDFYAVDSIRGDSAFGEELADVGDLDGDGVRDFATTTDGAVLRSVQVHSGASGRLLRSLDFSGQPDWLGSISGNGGDFDGDGTPDFALVVGSVPQLISGATGAVLHSLPPAPPSLWRSTVTAGGDVNGDGRADVVVGHSTLALNSVSGVVIVYSGSSGQELYRLLAPPAGNPSGRFGWSVDFAQDVDGDGRDDYLVGANGHPDEAWLLSGLDGSVLWAWSDGDPASVSDFGRNVAGVGDVDADGIPDCAVSAPAEHEYMGLDRGAVHVYSGATGAPIHRFQPGWFTEFGGSSLHGDRTLDGAGDMDGDGHADILVGAPRFATERNSSTDVLNGRLRIYSGRDGHLLCVRDGNHREYLASAVLGLGDLDGDGADDVLFSTPRFDDPATAIKDDVPRIVALSVLPRSVTHTVEVLAHSMPSGFGALGIGGPMLELSGSSGPVEFAAFGEWHDYKGGANLGGPEGMGFPTPNGTSPLHGVVGATAHMAVLGADWRGTGSVVERFEVGAAASSARPSAASWLQFFFNDDLGHYDWNIGSVIVQVQLEPKLALAGSLVAGTTAQFQVEQLNAGETAYLLSSLAGTGNGPCPPQLGGLCLDLLGPVSVSASAIADAYGTAILDVSVPASASGITVHLQAVVRRGPGGVRSAKSASLSETVL